MILSSHDLMPILGAALARGQNVRMTVHGGSMVPFVRGKDTVELAPVQDPLRRGEIVLAQCTDGHYVIHRVVRLQGAALSLRGDSQIKGEGPIPLDQVLGRVIRSERDGRVRLHRKGIWRILGLLWLRAYPIGFYLLHSGRIARALGSKALRRVQRWRVIRRMLAWLEPTYTIKVADLSDLTALYSWMRPGGKIALAAAEQETLPGLTRYVARSGGRSSGGRWSGHRSGQVLGHVALRLHPETDAPYTGYWLYTLAVRSRYRGMGIGQALVERCIAQARSEGAAALHLFVFANNRPAIALYEKLGFERASMPLVEAALTDDVAKYGRQRVPYVKSLEE